MGVLKLVPKKAENRCLKDWWPLTMLPIIYKLIAKLIIERFSPFNSALISIQQTGFILGRHILENISLAWMTHDWVVHHNIPMLLVLLDFEKAFDRVEHTCIWAMLTKDGLGGTFLHLMKGLLSRASSKVHINRHFSQAIPITRGYNKAVHSPHSSLRSPLSR